MSAAIWTVVVGGLRMQLRESRGGYTLVFSIVSDPTQVCLTHLGCDRANALHIFARKVECHRTMIGETRENLA
jgi:hypothetical protein